MDHTHADEHQLADRYLMGRLDDAERRRFEEHFVDCPVCLERLESVQGLRGGLKDLPPSVSAAVPAAPSFERFARPRALPFAALLAAACVLMAAAASLYFYGEARRARQELEAGRQASAKARLRQAELEQALQKEPASPRPSDDVAAGALRAAPLAATVFTLNLTRAASAIPSDRIVLPESPGWLVLLFDRPDQPNVRGYRVRISTAGGRSVGEPVIAGSASGGMLAVSVPSSLLASGDYRLAVEDVGSGAVLATYRFRAGPNP